MRILWLQWQHHLIFYWSKCPLQFSQKVFQKTLQMAQNHDKKFDATAAQLLWLKENLYSRCCEDTIHFSDLRDKQGTKLLAGQ